MPPARFGRKDVLDAALEIVRERGYEVLSARAVAERAGCSVQPIYSLFGDMTGLMQQLYKHARAWVTEYNVKHAHDGETCSNPTGLPICVLPEKSPSCFLSCTFRPIWELNT